MAFARFLDNDGTCSYDTFAIGNNPLSPDAVHPVVMTGTTRLNSETDSLVFFHDPNPEWIVQEVGEGEREGEGGREGGRERCIQLAILKEIAIRRFTDVRNSCFL